MNALYLGVNKTWEGIDLRGIIILTYPPIDWDDYTVKESGQCVLVRGVNNRVTFTIRDWTSREQMHRTTELYKEYGFSPITKEELYMLYPEFDRELEKAIVWNTLKTT